MDQYNKAIEINPEGAAFYVNRGLSMKHLGDQFLEQALEDFNKAISLNPKDPKPYFNRGTIYTGKRDFVRAHEDYDEAIRYAKELPEYDDFSTFLHAKGLAYSDEKKFVEAKRCFEEAIQKNPKSTQSIFHLGVVQHKLKELSNALKSFTEVIKRPIEEEKAEDRLAYESRGLVYFEMKSYLKALEDFNKAIELQPDYPDCYYYRGLTQNKLENYNEAIENFLTALQLNSRFKGSINNGLGYSYTMQNDNQKAFYYLQAAVDLEPNNPEFRLQRSMLYLNEKKYSDTINDLRLALENRPNDPALLYRLGQAHYLNRSFREALVDLQNSLNFEPDETYKPDIHYHIGLSYANLEDFESSIYPFTLAIEQSPLEAVYYHERAKAYLLTEEYESAVVDFDRVIEFQPNNPHAYFGRAFAHKNMRAYDKAVRSLYQADDFERAKELSPDDPQLIVNYKKIFNIKFIKLCEPGQEMV